VTFLNKITLSYFNYEVIFVLPFISAKIIKLAQSFIIKSSHKNANFSFQVFAFLLFCTMIHFKGVLLIINYEGRIRDHRLNTFRRR